MRSRALLSNWSDSEHYLYDLLNPKHVQPKWKKVDSIIKMWIYTIISQSLPQMILNKDSSARRVWLNLENFFVKTKMQERSKSIVNFETSPWEISQSLLIAQRLKIMHIFLDPKSKVSNKHLVIYTIYRLSYCFKYVRSLARSDLICQPS